MTAWDRATRADAMVTLEVAAMRFKRLAQLVKAEGNPDDVSGVIEVLSLDLAALDRLVTRAGFLQDFPDEAAR